MKSAVEWSLERLCEECGGGMRPDVQLTLDGLEGAHEKTRETRRAWQLLLTTSLGADDSSQKMNVHTIIMHI